MNRNFRPEPIYRDRAKTNGSLEYFIYHDNGRRAPVLQAWAEDQVRRGRACFIDLWRKAERMASPASRA